MTTTAITIPDPAEQALAPVTSNESINAFSSIEAFETAKRMAYALSCSSLVPEPYRGKENIPNVMIALELASRIGASVFAVMQNIDIIHGRPAWRATFLIATVNACGRFSPLRFRWQGEGKTWGCRAVAKDLGDGEECLGALITIALAEAEGWTSKKGSKWKTMPEQMLMYRAAAFWSRVYAPELSLGMRTTDEEADMVVVDDRPRGEPAISSAAAHIIARSVERHREPPAIEPTHEGAAAPDHDPETGEVFERQPGDDGDEDPTASKAP